MRTSPVELAGWLVRHETGLMRHRARSKAIQRRTIKLWVGSLRSRRPTSGSTRCHPTPEACRSSFRDLRLHGRVGLRTTLVRKRLDEPLKKLSMCRDAGARSGRGLWASPDAQAEQESASRSQRRVTLPRSLADLAVLRAERRSRRYSATLAGRSGWRGRVARHRCSGLDIIGARWPTGVAFPCRIRP